MSEQAKRTVLITGVSSGIGKSIAEELLNNNFYVIGSVRKETDASYLSERFPDKFNSVIFDVTDYKSIEESKSKVKDIIKSNDSYLSSIINNAGIALGGPIQYLDLEVFKKQFDVNYFGSSIQYCQFINYAGD